MAVRERFLPPGWYPASEEKTRAKIEDFLTELGPSDQRPEAVAGIVPHAGWDFSGRIALDVIRRLNPEHDVVVVVGGHMGVGEGVCAAFEEGFRTPLGVVENDLELLEEVGEAITVRRDSSADNTVEVQLPLIAYLFPHSRVLAMRAAPSAAAVELGDILYTAAGRLGRKAVVLGSTDLTHYGDAYGFTPRGRGKDAVEWVRNSNDRRFVDALLGLQEAQAIDLALRERSACSAGGAVAAVSFVRKCGATNGRLLTHSLSYDLAPSSSFVGYAGIIFKA